MNSEKRLSLNIVRKFFITNPLQLKQNKIAEFYSRTRNDKSSELVILTTSETRQALGITDSIPEPSFCTVNGPTGAGLMDTTEE